MLNNNMKINSIYLLVVLLWGGINQIQADASTLNMPGHDQKDSVLINPKIDIVIAQFISTGNAAADEIGFIYYERAQIRIIQSLQGTFSGNIKVSYRAKSFPAENKEVIPYLNTDYILFIRTQRIDPDDYELEKILPATSQNIARIKALIASQPAH